MRRRLSAIEKQARLTFTGLLGFPLRAIPFVSPERRPGKTPWKYNPPDSVQLSPCHVSIVVILSVYNSGLD